MSSGTERGWSSSGSDGGRISNSASGMQGGRHAMAGASPAPQSSTRGGSHNSWLALDDALKIFQEDLVVLQRLGVEVAVIPGIDLDDEGHRKGTAVVLPGVGFEDGDFVPPKVGE